jgi:predicted nucleic-acid-binding protein
MLFIFILYTSKKWQRKKLYRILPTSIDMDEINVENHSDENNDDDEDYYLRNGRTNVNETKINLDNETTKGGKGH